MSDNASNGGPTILNEGRRPVSMTPLREGTAADGNDSDTLQQFTATACFIECASSASGACSGKPQKIGGINREPRKAQFSAGHLRGSIPDLDDAFRRNARPAHS